MEVDLDIINLSAFRLTLFTALNAAIALTPALLGVNQGLLLAGASIGLFTAVAVASWMYSLMRQLNRKANFDHLTGLVNRSVFYSGIEDKITSITKASSCGCVIVFMMDLNGFKQINDTLGHQVGDLLLQKVAERLRIPFRKGDVVSRLGGDEFGVVLGTTSCDVDINAIGDRILKLFIEPFALEGHDADVGISIGIAMYPEHGTTAMDVVRCSDIAMYASKKQHLGYSVYTDVGDTNTVESLQLLSGLKNTVVNNELVLHYQVKKDLRTGAYSSMEALIRWKHPRFGLINSDKFIPAAEKSGFISDITSWVLEQAIKDFAQLDALDLGLKTVAVNISPYCAENEEILLHVSKQLDTHNVRTSSIIFEVTETSIDHTPESLLHVLTRLDMLGISLSIDDFGTGHSSLLYLKHLPIKEIKIDRSFVMDMLHSRQDFNIVESTIHLAHGIGCTVVAEGVETPEIETALKDLGCDVAQGYGIARPLCLEELTLLLKGRIE